MLKEKIAQIEELLEDEMQPWQPIQTKKKIKKDENMVEFNYYRKSYGDTIKMRVPLDDFDTVPELLDNINYRIVGNLITTWYKGLKVR